MRQQFNTQAEADAWLRDHAQRAYQLLNDPTFLETYKELLEGWIDGIIGSKPAQVELREDLYYRIRGLQDIAAHMNGWIGAHDASKAERGNVAP